MRDWISTQATKYVFHSGYKAAAMFVANGVGLLTLFTFLTAHAITAQAAGSPPPAMIDLWGITIRDLIASLGSAGAAYGFMLFRVKKLEDEVSLKVTKEHLSVIIDAQKVELRSLTAGFTDIKDELTRLRDVQTEHYKEMLRAQARKNGGE